MTSRENHLKFRALALRRIRSDEELTLETSAFESLYDGQFTLSTQLTQINHLVTLPTDAAPVSFERYPFNSSIKYRFIEMFIFNFNLTLT